MRKFLLTMTVCLFLSCAERDFFIPDEGIRDQGIPPEFKSTAPNGKTVYKIRPRDAQLCRGVTIRENGSLQSYRFGCRYNRLLAPSVGAENSEKLFVIPRAVPGFFTSGVTGVTEFNYPNETMTRLDEDNANLPDDEVFAICGGSDGVSVWIATDDGASSFNPDRFIAYNYTDIDTLGEKGGGLSNNYLLFTTTPAIYDVAETPERIYFVGNWRIFIQAKEHRIWDTRYACRDAALIHQKVDTVHEKKTVEIEKEEKDEKTGKTKKVKEKVTVTVVKNTIWRDYRVQYDDRCPPAANFGSPAVSGERFAVTHDKGVSVLDPATGRWRNFVKPHEDWASSFSCGKTDGKTNLCIEENTFLDKYLYSGNADLLDIAPSAIAFAGDTLYFGYADPSPFGATGLQAIDLTGNTVRTILERTAVYDIEPQGGALLVSTEKGLLAVRPDGGAETLSTGPVYDATVVGKLIWLALPEGLTSLPLPPR